MDTYAENLTIREAIEHIQRHLLTYQPDEYVLREVHTVRDIYDLRTPLKTFKGNDQIIFHISQIIADTIERGERMRTLDCLKVLRSLTKKAVSTALRSPTIDKLFRIYQEFIFRENEELQWCVSAILKDKPLSDEAINWLLCNAEKSEHIVNRLLLYPDAHPKIVSWAKDVYTAGHLPKRRSEVIALLVTPDNADSLSKDNDPNTLAWAIYKARLHAQERITMLKHHCTFGAFASIVEIADRLESPELLKHFLKKLRAQEGANNDLAFSGVLPTPSRKEYASQPRAKMQL